MADDDNKNGGFMGKIKGDKADSDANTGNAAGKQAGPEASQASQELKQAQASQRKLQVQHQGKAAGQKKFDQARQALDKHPYGKAANVAIGALEKKDKEKDRKKEAAAQQTVDEAKEKAKQAKQNRGGDPAKQSASSSASQAGEKQSDDPTKTQANLNGDNHKGGALDTLNKDDDPNKKQKGDMFNTTQDNVKGKHQGKIDESLSEDKAKETAGQGGFMASLTEDKNNKKNTDEKKKKDSPGKKAQKFKRRAIIGGRVASDAGKAYLIIRLIDFLRNMLIKMINWFANLPLVNMALNALHMASGALQAVGHALGSFFGAIGHGIGAIGHGIGGAFMAGAHAISHATATSTATGVAVMSLAAGTLGAGAIPIGVAIFGPKDGQDTTCTVRNVATGDVTNIQGVDGDWTKKGTKAYNLAKAVYVAAIKNGASAATAAAMVGNAESEGASTGNPLRWQGDQPASLTSNTGLGIFQFTPPSKVSTDIHSPKWSIEGQVKVFMDMMKSTGVSWKGTSPTEAAHEILHQTEAPKYPEQTEQARQSQAAKAYAMFNGIAGAEGEIDDASENDANTVAADNGTCSGTQEDITDGSGTISETIPSSGIQMWGYNALPSDVKRYVHTPKEVGMHYGTSTGWLDKAPISSDQCVGFVCSYFPLIWNTSAQNQAGNGKDQVDEWSSRMKGKVSDTPHAGALASTTNPALTGSSDADQPGHTYVVLHVLANGDIIIAQQNWPFLSGWWIQKSWTWNYGVLTPKVYQNQTKFFNPNPNKYNLSFTKS